MSKEITTSNKKTRDLFRLDGIELGKGLFDAYIVTAQARAIGFGLILPGVRAYDGPVDMASLLRNLGETEQATNSSIIPQQALYRPERRGPQGHRACLRAINAAAAYAFENAGEERDDLLVFRVKGSPKDQDEHDTCAPRTLQITGVRHLNDYLR